MMELAKDFITNLSSPAAFVLMSLVISTAVVLCVRRGLRSADMSAHLEERKSERAHEVAMKDKMITSHLREKD